MILSHLMRPGRIGKVELRNRLIFPPMQSRTADENCLATPRMADFYARRAESGVGLVIMQHSMCWPEARLPHGLGLWDDACIAPLSRVVRAVHAHNAAIGIELGGRGTRQDNGQGSVAPSAVRLSYEKEIPHALSVEQLEYFVECYGQAARRVVEAGMDVIEIHAAHGKLISQFLSPYTNRRTDGYGGSVEGRTRFPREIVESVRKAAGEDIPIIFRMSMTEHFEGGLELSEALEQIRLMEAAGVDCFEASSGSQEFSWRMCNSYLSPRMGNAAYAQTAKEVTTKPVIAVARIQDALMAEQILAEGQADFVSMGRPFMADPDLLAKTLQGKTGEIRRCLYCLNCSTWNQRSYLRETGIGCTVNASLCREGEEDLPPVSAAKRILVAGGGLAGMEAARVLARRGHSVDLYEKSEHLGGQWRIASQGNHKKDFKTFIPWLMQDMRQAGVRVHTGTPVDAEFVREQRPDAVILATGAVARELRVDRPSHGGPELIQGMDVIMGHPVPGNRIVIVGGRYIGAEAAIILAGQGKHVSVVDALPLGNGLLPRLFGAYRDRMVELGVFFFDNSPVLRLTSEGIDIAHAGSMLSLKADVVVTAIGTLPETHLADALKDCGIPCHSIGDCAGIGDALKAVRDGADIGRML